ncbi:MAG: hypothetical protein WA775_00840, partial [Psychroserpens sp.]
MKKQILLVCLLLSAIGYTQNGINYKALIKDGSGNVISNQNIDVRFTILNTLNTSVYEEINTVLSDNNGIIIVNIGEGTTSDLFANINWNGTIHSLKTEIDPEQDGSFIDLGTSEFKTVPYALNVTGLETIDEGNGIGWRLVGRNSDNYGNIGFHATDLSHYNVASSTHGATGTFSVAMGFGTTASGFYSMAMGQNTTASGQNASAFGRNTQAIGNYSVAMGNGAESQGDFSFAFGDESEAQGENSIAMGDDAFATNDYAVAIGRDALASGQSSLATGYNTTASGDYSTAMGSNTTATFASSTAMGSNTIASSSNSTAMGENTTASGLSSTAMGGDTTASGAYSTATGRNSTALGVYSTAMGFNTKSDSFRSIALGSFNIGGGMPSSWSSTDPLFEIGNGTLDTDRNNALTVLKNGNVGIGTNAPQELVHIAGGRLRIGNETIEDGGSDILSFSSSLVPTVDGDDRLGGPSRRWLDVYAINGAIQTSDRREKKNIENLNYGLAEVLKMQPI